jgi:hypothetical protein
MVLLDYDCKYLEIRKNDLFILVWNSIIKGSMTVFTTNGMSEQGSRTFPASPTPNGTSRPRLCTFSAWANPRISPMLASIF